MTRGDDVGGKILCIDCIRDSASERAIGLAWLGLARSHGDCNPCGEVPKSKEAADSNVSMASSRAERFTLASGSDGRRSRAGWGRGMAFCAAGCGSYIDSVEPARVDP